MCVCNLDDPSLIKFSSVYLKEDVIKTRSPEFTWPRPDSDEKKLLSTSIDPHMSMCKIFFSFFICSQFARVFLCTFDARRIRLSLEKLQSAHALTLLHSYLDQRRACAKVKHKPKNKPTNKPKILNSKKSSATTENDHNLRFSDVLHARNLESRSPKQRLRASHSTRPSSRTELETNHP